MIASTPRQEWVLAIDDDPWALEMTAVTLGEHGWHVQRATSGEQALEIVTRLGAPALVLVDAMMPNEDGFSVCRRLRGAAALRLVPIVFVTALDDEAVRVQALEAGADDFITKPVSSSLLVTRVRTLIELRRRRESDDARTRLGIVIDALGEGVITLDDDDRVVYANRAALALLGLPRNPLTAIHLPSHIARHWTVVRGQVGRDHDARLVFRTRDDVSTTAIDWTARTLSGDGDETWTVVVRDATDLWERDQALQRMMKSLGHKLRTPLTGLSASLEFARECEIDEMGAEMLEMAGRSAQRLHDTLIRMLEFVDSAGPTEFASISHRQTSPDELVAELTEQVSATVTTSLTRPVRIELDVAVRAVEELVANAQTAGASKVAIHVAPHPDRSVQFEITDDGPGVPVAAEARIFEPFYQLDPTGEHPGVGLGLSILRSDIGRAGGAIGAWTEVDGGTTVWFRLPDHSIRPARDARPANQTPTEPSPGPARVRAELGPPGRA
jgi:DNA-binding response OmpR family regulator